MERKVTYHLELCWISSRPRRADCCLGDVKEKIELEAGLFDGFECAGAD